MSIWLKGEVYWCDITVSCGGLELRKKLSCRTSDEAAARAFEASQRALMLQRVESDGGARKKDVERQVWAGMFQRCYNPNATVFRHYGGRGIRVCKRWRQFKNFLADMGRRPGPKFSIDRINVNGDYAPKNCRWATPKEQAANKRAAYWRKTAYEYAIRQKFGNVPEWAM